MRLTLEHSDVIKALALYVQTKGFTVEVKPENFVIANESETPGQFDLVVLVKNADMGVSAPVSATQPAAQPRPATPRPVARPVAAAAPLRPAPPPRPASKNDMFRPVAPPRAAPPPPKHRILDKQALSSPALALAGQHPHMPAAQAVVHAYEGADTASNYVDDAPPAPAGGHYPAPPDTSLVIDPADMSPEDREVFEEILLRSATRAEEGPVYATDGVDDPILPGGHLEDE